MELTENLKTEEKAEPPAGLRDIEVFCDQWVTRQAEANRHNLIGTAAEHDEAVNSSARSSRPLTGRTTRPNPTARGKRVRRHLALRGPEAASRGPSVHG